MTTNKRLAEIAPAIPFASPTSPSVYTYAVPARTGAAIQVGSRVTIPLGRQRVDGTVLRLHTNRVPFPTKQLVLHSAPPLTDQQITFATWLSHTMHGSLGYTLRLFFSPKTGVSAKVEAQPNLSPVISTLPNLLIEKNDTTRYNHLATWLKPAAGHTQVLILIPELRFLEPLQAYLAQTYDNVVTYTSEQTLVLRDTVWQHVYTGKPLIVIGTQKALFLPWRTLTHIVLEEEFLETHKLWDQYPRLDNRDGVRQLAKIQSSQLLYSSSALSLARAADSEQKRVQIIHNNPIAAKPQIISPSFAEREKNHLLPPEALTYLKGGLKARKQSLILHNQRGAWRTAFCNRCRQVVRCPDCAATVFVTGSSTRFRIQCRECQYKGPLPDVCPHCKKKGLRVFGAGSQKIAGIMAILLPKAKVLEISAGSTPTAQLLEGADIIIGTTAVWRYTAEILFDRALWLFPETTLLYPDYRSSERGRALLAQLQHVVPARRKVMVVTRYKELTEQTLAAPVEKVVPRLLRERERLLYPPYATFVRLTCYGRSEAAAITRGREVRELLDAQKPTDVRVRGPYQGFNKKEDGHFTAYLLLAGPLEKLTPLYKDLPINRADLSPAQIL